MASEDLEYKECAYLKNYFVVHFEAWHCWQPQFSITLKRMTTRIFIFYLLL